MLGAQPSLYQTPRLPIPEGKRPFQEGGSMKKWIVVTAFLMSVASIAATTQVYLREADSRALYDALDVRIINGRSDWAKVYRSADGQVEIYCTKSKIPPPAIQYGCNVKLDK